MADTDPTPNPAPAPAPSGNDPLAAFQRLLDRSSGDGAALARQLFEENYRHRERIRELERVAPAQGAVVLTPEQAQLWGAYQHLGNPDDVTTTISDYAKLKRDIEIRDVAAASGYALEVLRTLAGELSFEIKLETKDGKTIQAVYVKPKSGDPVPLETYAAANWGAFLPALKPASGPIAPSGAPNPGPTNPAGLHGQQPPAPFDPKNPPRLSQLEWKK